jgi:hypothetical protein
MEHWNVGIMGLADCSLILCGWPGSENKIRAASAFDSQYSIFPPFHYSMGYLTATTTPLKWSQSLTIWIRIHYFIRFIGSGSIKLECTFAQDIVQMQNAFDLAGFIHNRQDRDLMLLHHV